MRTIAAMLFVGGILAVASMDSSAQPPEGKGDKGGDKGGKGPGGKGGFQGRPGGFGGFGMSAPGQIMPTFLQDRLKLTPEQKKDLEALQKDVDSRLEKILSDDQRQQLKQMRERGGRGPGGRPGGEKGNPPPKKD